MAVSRSAPTLLRENIFFLVAGTCLSCLTVLLFDARLYTTEEIFILFTTLFVLFFLQAFLGSRQLFITARRGVLLFVQSFALVVLVLGLAYAFLLPFPFDWLQTLRLCLLVTLVETSLHFFLRYQKQFGLNEEKEKRLGQTVRQQQVKELEVLKQQIDPHFIFNSFNTLSFLIDEDSQKARQFSNKLASVYRYIIFNSGKNLVSLSDEIGFARDYAFLQEIRHSNEVQIRFTVPSTADNCFILPVSIQLLIENAIKHNDFNEAAPLAIEVALENGGVAVQNNVNPRNYNLPSSKIGLANLRDRSRLILGKDLTVTRSNTVFKVLVPVLQQ